MLALRQPFGYLVLCLCDMMQKPLGYDFIHRLIKGDKKAVADWYDHSAPLLLAISMRYATSVEDAEDWLHNAMMKMLKALPAFEYGGPGRFEAWMKKIMVNTALAQLRTQAKKRLIPFEAFEEILASEADSDDQVIDERPDPDTLIVWIQSLPIGYRTVLNLYVFEQFSHKEIADELGISENTSKSQLSKARAYLRKKADGMNVELQSENNG